MARGDLAPIIPAIILIVTASFLALAGRLIPARYRGILATLAGAGAVIAIPFLDRAPGGRAFWPWGPPTLFGGPLAFGLSGLAAPFVVAVCLLNLAGTLAAWQDDELHPSRQASPNLGLSATALLFLLAANWLTLVVAAIIFDVMLCLWFVRRRPASGVVGRFLLAISTGDLALVATAYLSRLYPAGERLWPIPSVGGESASLPVVAGGLLALAALLRLGAYPLDSWLRPGPVPAQSSRQNLREGYKGGGPSSHDRLALLIARSLGLYLWLLATAQGAVPGPWGAIILILAVLGMSATAILTWQAEEYRQGLAYLAAFLVSQAVLAVPLMGQSGLGIILVLSGNLLLGVAILSLARIKAASGAALRGRSLLSVPPVVLVIASLFGLPATLGFIGRVALYRLALSDGNALLIFVMLFGEALVFSALWRWLRSGDPSAGRPFLLRPIAACFLALPLLLFGVSPPLLEQLMGAGSEVALPSLADTLQALDWPLALTLLLPFPLAYWLERRHVFARSVASEARRIVAAALRLEWAEQTLTDLLGRAGKMLMLLWNVLEGEHYLGWGLVLALGALLFWASR